MRTTVTVGKQYKITIPKTVRRELDLEEGDAVELEVSKV